MGIKIEKNDINAFLQKYIKAAEEIKSHNGKEINQAIIDMGGSPEKIHEILPLVKDPKVAQKAAQSEKHREAYIKDQNKSIEVVKLIEKKLK